MTTAEFSRQFDVRFNNIDSNLAHSVTEYEKSLYLTQAQLEIVKNYFNPKGNKYQEGFDGSPKRDVDFSNIIKVQAIGTGTQATTTGAVTGQTEFGIKTLRVRITDNVMMVLNERFSFNGTGTPSSYIYDTTVVPIDYKQYQTILGKAYKDPPLRQTWRFVRSGAITNGVSSSLDVELITKSNFNIALAYVYYVRYLKRPVPIILENLSGQGLTIENISAVTECELAPELHDEILARAIEIAKADYSGDLNSQVEVNKRVE
jgi:hypothetical protein